MKNLDLNSVFTRGSDTGYGVPYENALYVPAREGYNEGKCSQKHKAIYELSLTHNLSAILPADYYFSYLTVDLYSNDNKKENYINQFTKQGNNEK